MWTGTFINIRKGFLQIHSRSKAEVPLSDVDRAKLVGKVAKLAKEILMDRLEPSKGACLDSIKHPVFKRSSTFFFLMCLSSRAKSAKFISPSSFSSAIMHLRIQ